MHRVPEPNLAGLRDRYGWFPDRGETVTVGGLPEESPVEADEVRHGGKDANQAVAAASAGVATAMLGAVGPDHGSFGVLDRLRDAGVNADRVRVASEPTGPHVFVGPAGNNRIVVRPSANGALDRSYVRGHYDAVLAADCCPCRTRFRRTPSRRCYRTSPPNWTGRRSSSTRRRPTGSSACSAAARSTTSRRTRRSTRP